MKKGKSTPSEYVERFKAVHGDTYDYSLVLELEEIRAKVKVPIICRKHGVFYTEPIQHCGYHKTGCRECANERKIGRNKVSKDEYIQRFNEKHSNKYDYSLWKGNDYNALTRINVICPDHGPWEVAITNHVCGSGCPACASEKKRMSTVDRIAQFRNIHGDKYDYSEWLELTDGSHSIRTIIPIKCTEHGTFYQTIDKHGHSGTSCPKCNRYVSAGEQEVAKFVKSLGVDIVTSDRDVLNGKELDILIPSQNIAIEYCGLFWHSDAHDRITPNYHRDKMLECNSQEIQLLTLFEDEWLEKREQVKRKIASILGKSTEHTVYARKCNIVPLTTKQKKEFFDANHIQGNGPGSVTYGLMHNDILVAAMTFIKQPKGRWDLNRYATSCNVPGGFSKLLKHFTRNHEWKEVVSFADLRWSKGTLYEKNGFTLDKTLPPDYCYLPKSINTRVHKFNYRHKNLPNVIGDMYDPTLTEHENTRRAKHFRIYNCGLLRYVLKNGA